MELKRYWERVVREVKVFLDAVNPLFPWRPVDLAAFLSSFLWLGLPACVNAQGQSAETVRNRPAFQALPVEEIPRSVKLPPGFTLHVFASGLEGRAGETRATGRFMGISPDGHLYVSLPRVGKVVVLPDRDHDGRADEVIPFATGLNLPHGIAFREGAVYVAETGTVLKFTDTDGDLRADLKETIVPNLPTYEANHWTRTIGFGPDGMLYVSVGSSCNVCDEKDPRSAAIVRYHPNGTGETIFARGLRNSVGFVWHPETGQMWATDNGRDRLGDDYPPEEINLIAEGQHYGWPYCHDDRLPDPDFRRPDFCQQTQPPVTRIQAHSAALGLRFYTGTLFPPEYRGDLFVALHGSWNRSAPTGYKVVRVKVRNGRPTGEIEDFVTGWLQGEKIWGSPVDLIVGAQGELYITDDYAGNIYRVTYAH